MVVTMAITYVFQLAGFISYIIKFSPNTIQNHKEIILIQPYFECIQRFLILFLVHFQFHAFYKDPIRILEIISRNLHYGNITITVLSVTVYISITSNDSYINEIYRLLVLIILFILISFSYYQVYIISINTKNTNIRQVLGFNILYSLFLPFITIQMARSIVVV